MENIKSKIAVFLIAAIVILSYALTACSSGDDQIKAIKDRGVLRVGVKVDVPRFGYLNPATGEMEGLEIDLARIIAKDILGDAGAATFININAQTRGAMLDNGEIDIVIATFTITDERKESFNFSRPYYTDELGYIVSKDSPVTRPEDMGGKNIGVVQGSTAKPALENECALMGIDVVMHEYSSYPEVKAALAGGEVEVFVADKSILFGYLDETCILLEAGFNPQHYGIASKLENNKLAERIDSLLGKLEDSGELTVIIEEWGL